MTAELSNEDIALVRRAVSYLYMSGWMEPAEKPVARALREKLGIQWMTELVDFIADARSRGMQCAPPAPASQADSETRP